MNSLFEGKIVGGFLKKLEKNTENANARPQLDDGLFKVGDNNNDIKLDSIEFLSKKETQEVAAPENQELVNPNAELDAAENVADENLIPEEQIGENFENEYAELGNKEVDNKTNLNELKAKQKELINEQSQISTKLKAEEKKLNSLQRQQENIERQQEEINQQMQRLENIMRKKPTKAIQAQYENLAQKSEALAGKMDAITNSITAQADKVADLKNQLNTVETNLTTVKDDINAAKLAEVQNKNQMNTLQAMGFLSNLVAGTLNQIGFIPPMMALNFLTNMSDMVITGAKNFINQTAATSMLSFDQQAYVAMNGIDLTEQLRNGQNRYTIAFDNHGEARLCDNSRKYGNGIIGGRYDSIMSKRSGGTTVQLNQDGTLTAGNRYDGFGNFNDFNELALVNNKYGQRCYGNYMMGNAFNKAAYVSGSTTMGMMFNNPVNNMFKLGFMAGRRAQQQMDYGFGHHNMNMHTMNPRKAPYLF